MKRAIWRAVVEVGFIVFLFYSNLLMGEFTRSGKGQEMGFAWAVADVLTPANFAIAIVAAAIGYVVFEFLRKKSQADCAGGFPTSPKEYLAAARPAVQSEQGDSHMRILRGLGIAALVCCTVAAQHHDGAPRGHRNEASHGGRGSGAHEFRRILHGFPVVAVPYAYPSSDPGDAPQADQPYTDSYQPAPDANTAGDSFSPPYSTAPEPPPHGVILDLADSDDAATPEPPHYYIALKDHRIYLAVAYWVQGDTLHYFLSGNTHNQVSLSLLDRGLTERLNRESGTEVRLPAVK